MKGIYIMDMSINFLLQATRVLHNRNYDENELNIIYEYLIKIDDETLSDYYNTCTILSYENDLELYIEMLSILIVIFEEKEEYEKCGVLKNKIEESITITKKKII
jgi:hypothetical protein